MSGSQLGLFVLMFIAGVGVPILAAMNAGLGVRINSPVMAVFILTCVAAMGSGLLLTYTGMPKLSSFENVPKHLFFAGLLFILYILSITFSAPKIGLGNAIFLVLLGQLCAAAVIDHFGLFGAQMAEITPKRILGIVIMVIGIYLARKEIL